MLHVHGIATRVHRALVFAYDDVYDRRGRLKEDDRWAMEYSVRDGAAVVELFHATASREFQSLDTAELRARDHELAEYTMAMLAIKTVLLITFCYLVQSVRKALVRQF